VTYTWAPSGVTATPIGNIPTCTVATTLLLDVAITEIVLFSAFAT
jgi:hypothetical protein